MEFVGHDLTNLKELGSIQSLVLVLFNLYEMQLHNLYELLYHHSLVVRPEYILG